MQAPLQVRYPLKLQKAQPLENISLQNSPAPLISGGFMPWVILLNFLFGVRYKLYQLSLLLLVISQSLYHKILFSSNILCLWTMASMRRLFQVPPTTSLPLCFIGLSFALIRLLRKIMHLQIKPFFLSTHCWSGLILLFYSVFL